MLSLHKSPKYCWYLLAMLFLAGAVNYADRAATSSILPVLRLEFNLTNAQLGVIGSAFLWSYAAFSPLAGVLADRVSRSRIVILSLSAWSTVAALTATVRSFRELIGARVLLGISECAYIPAAEALIADHHSAKTRGTALGIHSAGLSFGLVLGGTFGGYAAERWGWRMGFVVLGLAGLLLAVLASKVLRDAEATRSRVEAGRFPPLRTFVEVSAVRTYWILVSEGMATAVGNWVFLSWLPLYFRETYNMSLATAGFSGTIALQTAATSGVLFGGFLSDWIARGEARRRLIFTAACNALSSPFLLAFLFSPGVALVTVCMFSYAFVRALAAVNQVAVICEVLPSRARSTGIGMLNMANCFAGGLGVLTAGFLKSDFGLAGIFGGLSLLAALAAFLALAASVTVRRDLARLESKMATGVVA